MIKSFLTLLTCTLFLNMGYSQDDFTIGTLLSFGPTWLNSDDVEVEPDGGSFAFKIGIVGDYSINEHFAISGKLMYAYGLGGKLKHQYGGLLLPNSDLSRDLTELKNDFSPGTTIDYKLSMIDIPFALKISSEKKGKFSYFSEFPIVGFSLLTTCKADINTQGQLFKDENVDGDLKGILFNWGLGAGATYTLDETTDLFFTVNYMQSTGDFTKNDGKKIVSDTITDKEDASIQLGQLMFSVGVSF